MFPKDRFRIDFSFDMGLNDFAADVLLHLESIYITDGVDGYLEKWGEHEVPLKNYLRLKKLLNEHTNTTKTKRHRSTVWREVPLRLRNGLACLGLSFTRQRL